MLNTTSWKSLSPEVTNWSSKPMRSSRPLAEMPDRDWFASPGLSVENECRHAGDVGGGEAQSREVDRGDQCRRLGIDEADDLQPDIRGREQAVAGGVEGRDLGAGQGKRPATLKATAPVGMVERLVIELRLPVECRYRPFTGQGSALHRIACRDSVSEKRHQLKIAGARFLGAVAYGLVSRVVCRVDSHAESFVRLVQPFLLRTRSE
jgi:hypothetical protein